MADINPFVAVAVHGLLFVIGVIGNLFILIVHFLDLMKTPELNPCDLIINSISICNIFLQGTVFCNEVCYFLFVVFYSQDWVVKSLVVIMSSWAFSSLWCSTCLCFYYCVKIVNFSGTFFHKLKAKLPTMVPWLIVLSVALSWVAGLGSYWDMYRNSPLSTANFTGNGTLSISFNFKSRCNCLFQLYMLFSGMAFTIIFFTAGVIITSLSKHMIRMRRSNEGSGAAKIDSHLSAAKTVTSLLILYLTFYGALNFIFNEITEVGNMIFSLLFIVVSGFPTINSIILITGNRKLTNVFKQFLGIKSITGNTEVTVTTY